jgi:beta-lactamase regulating signal transducer with metallopeptidase domain
MSYFLRAALLWLGAFFLIYVPLSIGVVGAWQFLRRRAATWDASFLYGLRVFPITAAALLVVFLVVPSFLRLEQYQTDETVGYLGIGLALGGMVVVGFGAASALLALWKTSRFLASCPETRSRQLDKSGAWVVEIATTKPMLLVTGIYRPKLLISEQVVRRLDEGEMRAAIRHELAHACFHDNFKKLVLRVSKFPFLSGLDRSWMHAAEIRADDAAATDESTAIDLASALLKVATPTFTREMPELATSLMPDTQDALSARIERLVAWQPRRDAPRRRHVETLFILIVLGLLAIAYEPLLRRVHELSELLIR